jgi:hypothetical protein
MPLRLMPYHFIVNCRLTNRKHRTVRHYVNIDAERDYVAEKISVSSPHPVEVRLFLDDGCPVSGPCPMDSDQAILLISQIVYRAGHQLSVEVSLRPNVSVGRKQARVQVVIWGYKAVTRNLQLGAKDKSALRQGNPSFLPRTPKTEG